MFVYIKEYSMKKVALSLIALLAAGSFAFAEDVAAEKAVKNPIDVAFSANASASWGLDLDNGTTGFSNATEAKLKITILPEGDSEKGTDNKVGGYIKVENLKVESDEANTADDTVGTKLNVTIGDITAKILFNELYVKIYAAPDTEVDYAAFSTDGLVKGASNDGDGRYYSDRYGASNTKIEFESLLSKKLTNNGGITLGYVFTGLGELSVELASLRSWKIDTDAGTDEDNPSYQDGDTDANTAKNNVYNTKTQFSYTADPALILKAGFTYSNGKDTEEQNIGAGAFFAYAIPTGTEGWTISPTLGLDYVTTLDSDVTDAAYEVIAGGKVRWPGSFDSDDGNSGLFAGVQYVKDDTLDSDPEANLVLSSYSESGVVLPNVAFRVSYALGNVTKANDAETSLTATNVWVKYDAGEIKPWGEFSSDNITLLAAEASSLFVKLGVDYTPAALPLVTLSAEWDSNDLTGGDDSTIKNFDGDKTQTQGQLVFTAKVSY
jgi:hypothetical protein